MLRQVIQIDEEKCIGCGLCVKACHENALGLVNGKATLLKDDYCDGMGDCLPHCPNDAISFILKETVAYDSQAVAKHKLDLNKAVNNWPIQIKLVSVTSPVFFNCDLLIAADCSGFVCKDFSEKYMKGHTVLIGCSKLDNIDYSEKLTMIFANNLINSVTVTRMSVPCCGGLENMVKKAIENSGKAIPCKVITFNPDGEVIDER